MSSALRVLLVEDSPDDAMLIERALHKGGWEIASHRVETEYEMRESLKDRYWDVILSDYNLPTFSAPQALGVVKDLRLDIPFIVLSGEISDAVAVDLMKMGAHDFLQKSNLARLSPAIDRELREAVERQARRRAEEGLRQSEARFRLLIENTSDVIAMVDQSGYLTYISPSIIPMLGYDPNEITGDNVFEFVRVSDRSRFADAIRLVSQYSEEAVKVESWWLNSAGEWRVIEAVCRGFEGEAVVKGCVISLRDISDRKFAERRLQQQLARLGALRSIDTAIAGSLDLNVTLGIILDQATRQLGVNATAVYLLNSNTRILDFRAGRGLLNEWTGRRRVRVGEGYAGRVALTREAIIVPDLEAAENVLPDELIESEGFKAYFCLPLVVKGQVRGVLEVFHREALSPESNWMEFLEILAGEAAIAIDNATLFEDLQRSNLELERAYDETLEGWAKALELRDRETEGHSQRVTSLTVRLAERFGIRGDALVHIRRGALLHDIGKMGISDEILRKPGKLNDEEWEVIRQHPLYAFEWLQPISFLRPALDIPRYHHERWDGSGYPYSLKGQQIPLSARIFAVVDVWDALSHDRPYKKAWPLDKVRAYLKEESGKLFDPQVVTIFFETINAMEHPPI